MARSDLSAYKAAVEALSPLRFYMLDDALGAGGSGVDDYVAPVIDYGSHGADGRVYQDVLTGSTRYCVPCARFPYTTLNSPYQLIKLPNRTDGPHSSYSMCALIQHDRLEESGVLYHSALNSGDFEWSIVVDTSAPYYRMRLENGANNGAVDIIPRMGWAFVAFTVTGSTATFYVNGESVGTATGFSSLPATNGASDPYWDRIGRSYTGGSGFFGSIAGIALFASDISASIPTLWAAVEDEMQRCQRGAGINLRPNWREPVVERLEWSSPVLNSYRGYEQRYGLRAGPRRTIEYLHTAHDSAARRTAQLWLREAGRSLAPVPLWYDCCRLTAATTAGTTTTLDTTDAGSDRFASYTWAMLTSSDGQQSELVRGVDGGTAGEVDLLTPVQNTWPAGTLLVPVALGRLAPPGQFAFRAADVAESVVRMECADEVALTAATESETLGALPLWSPVNDWSTGVEVSWRPLVDIVDYGGDVWHLVRADFSPQTVVLNLTNVARADVIALRARLQARDGRRNPFAMPSMLPDLQIVGDYSATDTEISFAASGLEIYAGGSQQNLQAIRITMNDGTTYDYAVNSISNDGTNDVLTLASGLTADIAAADVKMVSWIAAYRLAADSVEIQHRTTDVSNVTLTLHSIRES